MAEHSGDLRFPLPAVADPPAVEVGVILLGLDADRLLAGLGMAGSGFTDALLDEDPAAPAAPMAPAVAAGDAATDATVDATVDAAAEDTDEVGEDPALIALLVDQARHGAGPIPMDDAVLAGARRWRSARTAMTLDERMAVSGSPRQAWVQVSRMLATDLAVDRATHAYLTACWLRRDEVDRRAAAVIVAGRVGAGGGPSQT